LPTMIALAGALAIALPHLTALLEEQMGQGEASPQISASGMR